MAIVISVWASFRAGAIERRRYRLQARGIAVAIYPAILKLPAELENARSVVSKLRQQEVRHVGSHLASDLEVVTRIGLPAMIERNMDQLFMLGPVAGPTVLQLVTVIEQHNEVVDRIASHIVMAGPGQWAGALDQVEESLNLIGAVVAKSAHEIGPIHDKVRG